MPAQMPAQMHPGQTAEISVNNDIVGMIGKLHPAVEKENVYVLEINLDKLISKKNYFIIPSILIFALHYFTKTEILMPCALLVF